MDDKYTKTGNPLWFLPHIKKRIDVTAPTTLGIIKMITNVNICHVASLGILVEPVMHMDEKNAAITLPILFGDKLPLNEWTNP